MPFTKTGAAVLILGIGAYLAGWWFGWIELMVLSCGCLVGLLLATPFIIGRQRLTVERTVSPTKVEVGTPALATIRVENPTRSPIVWRVIQERVGAQIFPIEVDGLGPGASLERVLNLPTGRRGRIMIGPSVISRADPLGLMRRDVVQTGQDELWVQPRVVPTMPAPIGFAKDLEGPTNDTSPAGDVSFHTLREYSVGDDPRHVHWLSTARTGNLMVKHYVDNRRPHLTVVLDDALGSYSDDEFEVAVDVAASLGVNGLLNEQPISMYHGTELLLSERRGLGPSDLLDALTLVETRQGSSLDATCSHALDHEPETSVLVVVTGALDTGQLLRLVEQAKRRAHVLLVRVWPTSEMEPVNLPGATLLDVDDVQRFGVVWNQAMR